MGVPAVSASEETYRALQNLPQFPALATKLMRLLSHDDADIKEIVNLIRADVALAAELLRIVNSPTYGFACRIGSIQSAVALVGFDTVKVFALTVSMKGFLQSALRLDLLRKAWRHSLACAIICENLSVACSPVRRADDRAYTAGLLHDIGRLGLFVAHPQQYSALLTAESDSSLDFLAFEREVFGIDHCEAGAWLAEKWNFPEELQEVAADHHTPVSTVGFALLDLVRIGVLLADELGFSTMAGPGPRAIAETLSMLPRSAQYRVEDIGQLKTKITDRLNAFD
jgi:putative nucleotidyltransferase with HDIG domain